MNINVALDGPSGAGKSTIAKAVAKKLEYVYVDTGALYRTIAYCVISNGIDPKDEGAVVECLGKIDVRLEYVGGAQHVMLGGEDVSDKIRTPEISMGASAVSAIPKVREFLFDLQKDIAKHNNIIMDGRDIGTVVCCLMLRSRYFLLRQQRKEPTGASRNCRKRATRRHTSRCWRISDSVTITIPTGISLR